MNDSEILLVRRPRDDTNNNTAQYEPVRIQYVYGWGGFGCFLILFWFFWLLALRPY